MAQKCLWFFNLQELSKITMPIVFNEPLSFLQRISEYMEHTYLIHKACTLSDSIERMQVSPPQAHTSDHIKSDPPHGPVE